VEVPTALTAGERPRTGRRGKTDATDALAIARVLLRKKPLPQVREDGRSSDLKILSDYRDQLQQERTRIGNRLHADLMVLFPGYQHAIRRLTSQTSLAAVPARLRPERTVRARIARRRLADLRRLDAEIASLKRDMTTLLKESGTGLTTITGVGTLIAARIIGEVGDVRRFPTKGHFASANGTAPIPASSGRTDRHRLNRGGLRKLNYAIHTMAITQARADVRGRAYIERRRAEGKTWREAMRCLKRHLSNVVYRQLLDDAEALMVVAA